MKLYRGFSVVVLLAALFSASCGKTAAPNSSSSAGALTANTAINNLAPRRFARHTLNAAGSGYLSEFLRPDVKARLDEEPAGDADGGYDPSTAGLGTAGDESQSEPSGDGQNEDAQQPASDGSEDSYPSGSRLDTLKYSWAKKAFGDAIEASPTNGGVIVLYADDNSYDVERLIAFVEGGRDRIADLSGVRGDQIQVVFGGYRGVPQVELWVVPQGSPMPEFKTDERRRSGQPED